MFQSKNVSVFSHRKQIFLLPDYYNTLTALMLVAGGFAYTGARLVYQQTWQRCVSFCWRRNMNEKSLTASFEGLCMFHMARFLKNSFLWW